MTEEKTNILHILESENKRLLEESRSREQFLEALTRIAAAINSSLKLEEVLSLLCREVVGVFDIAGSAIYVFDVSTLDLRLTASSGIDKEGLERFSIRDTKPFIVNAFFTGKPSIVGSQDGEVIPLPLHRQGFVSMLAMPLIRDARGLGVLLLAGRETRRFRDEDLERAGMLADHAAIAAKNAMLYEKEQHKSRQLEVAIQEAHHRIKNNLQSVAVLLSLQMDSCDEPSARQAMQDSIQRINAISIVHELLSQDSDIRLIDANELLGKLLQQVTCAVNAPGRHVNITVDSQNLLISSKRATALALIAQELVSNALEHGMADKAEGTVEVSLHRSDNTVIFSVRDHGTMLAEEFDFRDNSKIGLDVVYTLAERELGGRIEFERCEPGLRVALYFEDAGIAVDV